MAEFEASVIIPVYNQWELTRVCLKTLAATTQGKSLEVLVVDNASSDATPKACPFLGQKLFGRNFRFIRNSANRNFGPASNQGALQARGEYLVFLNNDTELLPGWLEPLLNDFKTFPDIAATGPLLLYPAREPFGHTIQHLGVYVSPIYKVNHLYEGIPADSPLARKRRFFQIITAACMAIPRKLFMAAGMFDEAFINGFEDVDLCARLSGRGLRMTVNPQALVVHHKGQSSGRHAHEDHNSQLFLKGSIKLLKPDYEQLVNADGLSVAINNWLRYHPVPPAEQTRHLDGLARQITFSEIKSLLSQQPYWEKGWKKLLEMPESGPFRDYLREKYFRFFLSPFPCSGGCGEALRAGDTAGARFWLNNAAIFCASADKYRGDALNMRQWLRQAGSQRLAAQCDLWLENAPSFFARELEPHLNEVWNFARLLEVPLSRQNNWLYTAWTGSADMAARRLELARLAARQNTGSGPAFSLIMHAWGNCSAQKLQAATGSVQSQLSPNWELLMPLGAPEGSESWKAAERLAAEDRRVRIFPAEGLDRRAALNAAIGEARHAYIAFVPQNSVLEREALALAEAAIRENPAALLIYSDQDSMVGDHEYAEPYFKNGKWDLELLSAQNFTSGFTVFQAEHLRAIGGFRGCEAKDMEHDLALRFAEGQAECRFIHIPHVLCHMAAANTVRHGHGCGLESPLPGLTPTACLICDLAENSGADPLDWAAPWLRNAARSLELILLLDSEAAGKTGHELKARPEFAKNISILTPAHATGQERLNWAAAQTKADILGFVDAGLRPQSEGWLAELAAALCRPGIGACGGKMVSGKYLVHGGYAADASGAIKPLFRGRPASSDMWFDWLNLARTVDALDQLCLFTPRRTFLDAGGFDVEMASWSAQDYCLRLGEKGLKTIWRPLAEFELVQPGKAYMEASPAFTSRWAGRVKPLNPNLLIKNGEWLLADQGQTPIQGACAGITGHKQAIAGKTHHV